MTISSVVAFALVVSIFLIVFALGARATRADALFLIRQPRLLVRALAAVFVVVPIFALALNLVVKLEPHVRLAMLALAVSPVPPALPYKQLRLGGERSYIIGLLVATSLVSLVATPLLVGFAAILFHADARIAPREVATPLLASIALPLAVGMVLRRLRPSAAEVARYYALRAGWALLAAGVVVILATQWRLCLALIGDGTLLALGAMTVVGLVAGHLLGGPDPGRRGSLALATATRHPGVAIAIAAANFPTQHRYAAAAIVLFLLTNAIVSIPYVHWMQGKRPSRLTRPAAATAAK